VRIPQVVVLACAQLWRINEIAQIVGPDEAQRAALEELKTAMAKAVDLLKAGCPTDLPSTPTGRIEAMRVRLSAMLEAVRTVRAPLAKFYALLNDEQRARFNAVPSGEDQNEPERRRNLSVLCSERASGGELGREPRRLRCAAGFSFERRPARLPMTGDLNLTDRARYKGQARRALANSSKVRSKSSSLRKIMRHPRARFASGSA
jgi:LTXXQ motif family protein